MPHQRLQITGQGKLELLVSLKGHLSSLNIANNSLTAIPPAVGRLTNLRSLLVEVGVCVYACVCSMGGWMRKRALGKVTYMPFP